MCWNASASVAMVGLGATATVLLASRGEPKAIWLTLGYFTVMEALQAAGYLVVDNCGSPSNKTITILSYLHIAFQPLFINAFAMSIAPEPVPMRTQRIVYMIATACTAVIVFRLVPSELLGVCLPTDVMCGDTFCLISGNWHIAWQLKLNGLYNPISELIGYNIQFPDYFLAVFVLPLIYGAWRFVVLHLLAGPMLAWVLTSNPDEMPAVWCLFSIGILMIGLSPFVRYSIMGAQRRAAF